MKQTFSSSCYCDYKLIFVDHFVSYVFVVFVLGLECCDTYEGYNTLQRSPCIAKIDFMLLWMMAATIMSINSVLQNRTDRLNSKVISSSRHRGQDEEGTEVSQVWAYVVVVAQSTLRSFEIDRWVCCMRMPKSMFLWLCVELGPSLAKKNTTFRAAVPIEVRVGTTILRGATGMNYFHCSDRVGIGKTTFQEILEECVREIITVLGSRFLKWPQGVELQRIADGFFGKTDLPNCVGAIDGTHIPIRPPARKEAADYIYCMPS